MRFSPECITHSRSRGGARGVDPARPRVGTPIRNGCRSVTDCHRRREVLKGAPSLLRVPASEHAASGSSAPWFPRNIRKRKAERRDSIRSMGFRERPRVGRPMATYCPACPLTWVAVYTERHRQFIENSSRIHCALLTFSRMGNRIKMAGLSRSGGALRICSYISAERCTSAGRRRQVSKCVAQRSRSRPSLPRSKS